MSDKINKKNLKLPQIKNIKINNHVGSNNENEDVKKSPRLNVWVKIKSKKDCVNAQEYFSQFTNTKEKYDLRELKIGLKKVSNSLKLNDIFLINTGWDSVWDNLDYSFDHAEEIICKKYNVLVKERFERYKKFVLAKYKGKFFNVPLAYINEIVSFVTISDYQLHLSKQSGLLYIQTSFVNNHEKIICAKIFKDVFLHRFIHKYNSFVIKLHKN